MASPRNRTSVAIRANVALLALLLGGCFSAHTGEIVPFPQLAAAESLAAPSEEIVASTPVPASIRVGGHFGERHGRTDGRMRFHAGLDFAAPTGTDIYAVAEGVVEIVAHDDDRTPRLAGYGNAIVVHHPGLEVWTMYAHLSEVTVAEGDVVHPGTAMGRTGHSNNHRFRGMGAHLHFEVRRMREDGRVPFPGTYGRHNLDPEEWLASLGIVYGRGGVLETGEPAAAAAPDFESAADALPHRAWLISRTHGGAVATLATSGGAR